MTDTQAVKTLNDQRVLWYVLADYVRARPVHHRHEQQVTDISCAPVVQQLLNDGYLRLYRPLTTRIGLAASGDVPWYVITPKGRDALDRHQLQINSEKEQARAAFDAAVSQGNLNHARQILKAYDARQVFPPQPALNGHHRLTKHKAQAIRILLKADLSPALPARLKARQVQALRLQAVELALSGTIRFDRSDLFRRHDSSKWAKVLYRFAFAQAVRQLQAPPADTPRSNHNAHEPAALPPNDLDTPAASKNSKHLMPVQAVTPFALPPVRSPIRMKITLPYILLALVIAVVGTYLVSQIVFDTLEERFINQLIEVGKLSADRMVLEEQQRLETLRLLTHASGIAEAIAAGDTNLLRDLTLPLAINSAEEAVVILDATGVSLLTLRHIPGGNPEDYEFTTGDRVFADWHFVHSVLDRSQDAMGDKYAGIGRMPWGDYFYVAGPVLDEQNALIGVVLVGRSLDAIVAAFRQDTLAHTTIYDLEGSLLAPSLLLGDDLQYAVPAQQIADVLARQDTDGIMRDLSVASVQYSEILGPWEARGGVDLGVIGTALPQRFLASTSTLTRIQLFVLISAGLLAIILAGIYVSRRITKPLLQVVDASKNVAKGDLDVRIVPVGQDEVAILAHAFNYMVDGLKEATEHRLREIDLLKELEREKELRELKTRFVSIVSHEFRTPLTTILSSAEFIEHYGATTTAEKRDKHLDRIQTAVANMKSLIDDVLVIGKSESGRLELNLERLDLRQFCHDIADEMQAQATVNHRIVFTADCADPIAISDERLLRLAVANLMSNALKYSPEGGKVHLDLKCAADGFTIRVKDEGIGIPVKDQARLFETFHRAANVSNISGTGLGLYISRLAVELHDGKITFSSKEGIGTVFTIYIPRLKSMEQK